MYRAHFKTGNNFSSSLVDSAKVYTDQNEIMKIYKKRFKKNFDFSFDWGTRF